MLKTFKNTLVDGYNGKPIELLFREEGQTKSEIRPVELDTIMWTILNNSALQTQNDSIQGARLAESLDKAKDGKDIVMEDGVHDWLKIIAEKVTPTLFRINGNVVYKHICEGFEKAKQPKEEGK